MKVEKVGPMKVIETIVHYKCPFCHQMMPEEHWTPVRVDKHINEWCVHNPARKTCTTCLHYRRGDVVRCALNAFTTYVDDEGGEKRTQYERGCSWWAMPGDNTESDATE